MLICFFRASGLSDPWRPDALLVCGNKQNLAMQAAIFATCESNISPKRRCVKTLNRPVP
jgi:hypothetical protein